MRCSKGGRWQWLAVTVLATDLRAVSGHFPPSTRPDPDHFARFAIFKQVHYPSPVSPNGDHIGKPNPPVQMRNDIWRSPLSLRWRLLLLLVSSLCIAAVEKAGENDENNKPDETSNKKRARDRCIRHLWRALPSADCLPVSTCAAFLPSWALRAP